MQNYILDFSTSDCPLNIRELTLSNGLSYPNDEELIMLILGKGSKNNPIATLAGKVVKTINSSNQDSLIQNLTKIDGIGESKALVIAAALELGRRRNSNLRTPVNSPKEIIPYLKHYCLMPTEHFITITINGAKEILNTRVVSVGTINRAIIHPREVFASAIAEYASGIICCHNHPCGKCYPSEADVESTRILEKAAKILGIAFIDHIIITKTEYFSFLEHGLLKSQ